MKPYVLSEAIAKITEIVELLVLNMGDKDLPELVRMVDELKTITNQEP
jgi:hypothetical protein